MNAELYQRDWKIQVDDLDVRALNCQFRVEKTLKPQPNKLELRLFNLSPDHIAQITKVAKSKQSKGVSVQLSAGYKDNVPLIFSGDARDIVTTHDGTDRVTTIAALDGGRSYRESRINKSLGPGASVRSAILACCDAMGIGAGNAAEIAKGAGIESLGKSFPRGTVLSGKAADELTRLTRSTGLSWSIQNGVLQLKTAKAPLQTTAIRLAVDSGLIGSPSIDVQASLSAEQAKTQKSAQKAKSKAILVRVQTLMIPGLYPGRLVVLESENFNGGYEIVQIEYTGDTAGQNWYANMLLKPY